MSKTEIQASDTPAETAIQIQSGQAHAGEAGLRYVSDTEPGIRRQRRGKRFRYVDKDGSVVTDEGILTRINRLAIPPAYNDVWICQSDRGHLQATGRDARGRKQYRYHARWRTFRDRDKFSRVVEFAQRLPALRRRLRRDLKLPGLSREKVLAIVVSIMAQTLIRVGNSEYASSNKSYGLTTLRKNHLAFASAGKAKFRFRGKGGLLHEVALDDARIARLLQRCRQLPGQALFQYTDSEGNIQPVDSGLVNDYLRDAMGEDFTAKDFRTWGGTCAAIVALSATPLPEIESERTSKILAAIKIVAAQLRNTPAVCRNSYIHPIVLESWADGSLHRIIAKDLPANATKHEKIALQFLRKRLRRRA
jgi:DNA topoisomerase I